mmetsp:Transcript_32670/g.76180  ORF Transcript_32670/g.76180 Transcript_32670/m.76180 type:complete len:199 (+) Transcript_32670:72-668(+)
MSEFDAFAARLLLLGLLLGRRVVIPPLPCEARWAQSAMEPRHLRALEVGCGPHKQCVWLPMPHFKEPWCSGVDFLYDIDYRSLLESEINPDRDVVAVGESAIRSGLGVDKSGAQLTMSGAAQAFSQRVVLVQPGGGASQAGLLEWLPMEAFKDPGWTQPFPSRVASMLQAEAPTGHALSNAQLRIVKDCLQSLMTSRD